MAYEPRLFFQMNCSIVVFKRFIVAKPICCKDDGIDTSMDIQPAGEAWAKCSGLTWGSSRLRDQHVGQAPVDLSQISLPLPRYKVLVLHGSLILLFFSFAFPVLLLYFFSSAPPPLPPLPPHPHPRPPRPPRPRHPPPHPHPRPPPQSSSILHVSSGFCDLGYNQAIANEAQLLSFTDARRLSFTGQALGWLELQKRKQFWEDLRSGLLGNPVNSASRWCFFASGRLQPGTVFQDLSSQWTFWCEFLLGPFILHGEGFLILTNCWVGLRIILCYRNTLVVPKRQHFLVPYPQISLLNFMSAVLVLCIAGLFGHGEGAETAVQMDAEGLCRKLWLSL